jgi:hypothetical protein
VKILRRTDGTVVETTKDEKGELQVVKNAEGSVLMRMRSDRNVVDRNSGGGNEVQFLEFGDGTKVEVTSSATYSFHSLSNLWFLIL